MPLGSFRVNSIAKRFTVAAAAEVIRRKIGITVSGNAQVDTAQSKFGGASALFDGSGDRIVCNNIPSLDSNLTIEFWYRHNAWGGQAHFVDARLITDGSVNKPVIYRGTDNTIRLFYANGDRISGAFNPTSGVWYHIALTRSSDTVKLFVNGTQVGSDWTNTQSWTSSNYILGDAPEGGYGINGHLDEVRISNTARYTSNFTAPTAPFTNDNNTLFLMHCDGTDATTFFDDDNGVRAPKGITALGNAQIDTAQSKFGGASALFDGTGDYLEIPYTTGMDITNGDFTIEFWYRHPQTGIDATFGDSIIGRTSGGFGGFIVRAFANKITWVWDNVAGYDVAGFDPAADTWYHIAFVRSGTTLKCYTDGTERTVTGYVNRTDVAQAAIRIGKVYSGQPDDYTGHIDEIRISNTARYTTGFTAPTAPFVNDANTLLLIHANGTDASTVFRDDNGVRAQKGVQAIGNAQVDTAQSKFGGASLLLDGNGDFLSTPNSSDFYLNTGNWTGECWFRVGTLQWTGLMGQYQDGGSPGNGWTFSITGNGALLWQSISSSYDIYVSLVSANNTFATNTWNHAAFVIEDNILSLYCNGTRVAQQNISGKRTLTTVTQVMKIGITRDQKSGGYNTADNFLNGWMDEIRISNTVRYTGATYTVPTAPFSNDVNTVLLIHADGTDGSTVFFDDNGQTPQTP